MDKKIDLGLLFNLIFLGAFDAMSKEDKTENAKQNCCLNKDTENSEASDDDFEGFPIGYLDNLFLVQESDRISRLDNNHNVKYNRRANVNNFVCNNQNLFNDIEKSIYNLYKALPLNSKESMLNSIEDYCRFLKECEPCEILSRYKNHFGY